MYAIIEHGSHHYRISAGDRILVDRIKADVGAVVTLERVLLLGDGEGAITVGDALAEARVTATVVAHRRGRKLRVMTFKPKKRHRRALGYRSQLTELRVDDVAGTGVTRPKPKPAAATAAARKPTPAAAPAPKAAAAGSAAAPEVVSDETAAEKPAARPARRASTPRAPKAAADESGGAPAPRKTARKKPGEGGDKGDGA